MMSEVFFLSDNIISPLGFTTEENYTNLKQGLTGIALHVNSSFSEQPFYASLIDGKKEAILGEIDPDSKYTKFERLLILSITSALENTGTDCTDPETIFVISTTKGNISLLENADENSWTEDRIALHHSAKLIASHFKNPNVPVVVSNACISGLTAMLTAKRLIQSGRFQTAIVAGADIISKFILSGFQSFQAVSDKPCKPFDAKRNGVTLGEAAGTVILSAKKSKSSKFKFSSGAVSNDANHISGPSRTGEELCIAVKKSFKQAGVEAKDIGFICAHGTATVYNDEMEAKAFSLADLGTVPLNSLKGYFGHTLGAAGLIESIISLQTLNENLVLPTAGYETSGISSNINVSNKAQESLGNVVLKTASGFGGCNAALIFQKSQS